MLFDKILLVSESQSSYNYFNGHGKNPFNKEQLKMLLSSRYTGTGCRDFRRHGYD